jgi:group I intron endonuclease
MPVQSTCLTCGAVIIDVPSRRRQFCSNACRFNRPRKADNPSYPCEACGTMVHRKPSHLKRYRRVICSMKCWAALNLDKDDNGISLHRPGVYGIVHVPSGRTYIGSSKDISKRWTRHRVMLRSGISASLSLQSAWNIFGEDAFRFIVLEDVTNTSALLDCEQAWVDRYRADGISLFNVSPLVKSTSGMKQRDEVRARAAADPNRHFRGKLSETMVRTIKARLAGGSDYGALAVEYNVHRHTIYMIATGRTYPDVHAADSESVLE